MDDFNTFPPQPVVVTLACGTLELTPVRLGELPRLLALVRPLVAVLVKRVDLKRRLNLAGGVQRALPALARAIQQELDKV